MLDNSHPTEEVTPMKEIACMYYEQGKKDCFPAI